MRTPRRRRGDYTGDLGADLRAIRRRIEASGAPLLDREGVEREKAERRGGAPAATPGE